MRTLIFLLLSSLKWRKLATTGGTMLLSLGVYAMVWGWRYAAGIIILLFVHEMGHYIAARQCGLNVGAPTFIPFVGAWIELKDQPHDAEVEAYVAMAGPLVGSIGAVAVYLAGRQLDSNLMLAIAYADLFLNLINLLPVSPLDGGRITAIISPRIWLIGAPLPWWPSCSGGRAGADPDRHHRDPAADAGVALRPAGAGEHRLLRRRDADQARIRRGVSGADRLPRHHDLRAARDAEQRGAARLVRTVPTLRVSHAKRGRLCAAPVDWFYLSARLRGDDRHDPVRAGIDDEDFLAHLDVLVAAILRGKFDDASRQAVEVNRLRHRLADRH